MRIGTTSFGFRYQLLDPDRAPSLISLVDQAAELGLDMLQICENARPMSLPDDQWAEMLRHADAAGLSISLGCKTTQPDVFAAYLDRASQLPDPMLRLVFEEEDGAPPSRNHVDSFLAYAAPKLHASGVRLAIENHFDVPSLVLAEAVRSYPPELIGFCVDTANSLRNFESPEHVVSLLGPRAFCYHVKDFHIDGHLLGFAVTGAPLGKGALKLDDILRSILYRTPEPDIYVENWVPASGDRDTDVANDSDWLRQSLACLRSRAEALRASATA